MPFRIQSAALVALTSIACLVTISCNKLPFDTTTHIGEGNVIPAVDTATTLSTQIEVDSVYTFSWDPSPVYDSLVRRYEANRDSFEREWTRSTQDSLKFLNDSADFISEKLQHLVKEWIKTTESGLHIDPNHLHVGQWHGEYSFGYLEFPLNRLVRRPENFSVDTSLVIDSILLVLPIDPKSASSMSEAQTVQNNLDIRTLTKSHSSMLDTSNIAWDSAAPWHATHIADTIYGTKDEDTVYYLRSKLDSLFAQAIRDSLVAHRHDTDGVYNFPLGIGLVSDSDAIRLPMYGSFYRNAPHVIIYSSSADTLIEENLASSYSDYSVRASYKPVSDTSVVSSWHTGIHTAIELDFSRFFDSTLADSLYPFSAHLRVDISDYNLQEPFYNESSDSLDFIYYLTDKPDSYYNRFHGYSRGVHVDTIDALYLPIDTELWYFKAQNPASQLTLVMLPLSPGSNKNGGIIRWISTQQITLEAAFTNRK